MEEKTLLENAISFIEEHLDKQKLDSLLKIRKRNFIISIVSWILLFIAFPITIFLCAINQSLIFLSIIGFFWVFDITLFVLAITYLVKSSYQRIDAFNYINQIEWEDIYIKSFDKYIKQFETPFLKKVKFLNLERNYNKAPLKDYRGSPRSWLSSYIFYKTNQKRNCLNFSFEDKLVNYQFNQTIRTVEQRVRQTKNGTRVTYVYHFVATSILKVENKKFDQSYNGILIFPGKSSENNYKTESMQFNEKYGINVSNTDLRGPKVLRPKYIDNLTKKDTQNLSGIFFSSDIIIGHEYVTSMEPKQEICIFYKTRKLSREKILKVFAIKVLKDINFALEALTFLDGIY
ncbi:hypothetical protein [Spiroplasma cantharicola]|uniref:DUF3137 domain-containing protein n=1 Tax=Spiroplasma cantharicola TaxID=362837 RepID=A0A0M3SJK1_9MOLU|nr:hypothetical protein [Spiroplasma cantharicola]ALD66874.1 hypothetical protein SCANT_v1c09680 [Spiroplasma cantharicola]